MLWVAAVSDTSKRNLDCLTLCEGRLAISCMISSPLSGHGVCVRVDPWYVCRFVGVDPVSVELCSKWVVTRFWRSLVDVGGRLSLIFCCSLVLSVGLWNGLHEYLPIMSWCCCVVECIVVGECGLGVDGFGGTMMEGSGGKGMVGSVNRVCGCGIVRWCHAEGATLDGSHPWWHLSKYLR